MSRVASRVRSIRALLRRRSTPYLVQALRPFRQPGVLPDFLIIGAMKSGTTTLFASLCQHPGVLPARVKEVQFFSINKNYNRGERFYRAYFPTEQALSVASAALGYRPLTGEATPTMSLQAYAERAALLLPQARLIVTLRNPVDRAFSHYRHMCRNAIPERRSFETALRSELALIERGVRITEKTPRHERRALHKFGYLNRGYYAEQLIHWLCHYPREQLLILNFDEWKRDPTSAAGRVAAFLGLPRHDFEPVSLNEGGYREPMSPATHAWLTEHYRPHNRRLFDLLGEDWGWPC